MTLRELQKKKKKLEVKYNKSKIELDEVINMIRNQCKHKNIKTYTGYDGVDRECEDCGKWT